MNNVKTVYSLVFSTIVSLVLVAPVATLAYSLLTGKRPMSYLEGRKRPKLPVMTPQTIVGEQAQSAFDAALAFSVPRRDNALLVHTKWQRIMTRFAARLCGIDAYSTYYGSKFIHIDSMERIMPRPAKATLREKRRLEDAAQRYAEAIYAHPKIRWFFARADTPLLSVAGPARNLVSASVNYDMYRQHLLERLPASCTVIDLGYSKDDNIDDDFFRTDHHWRIQGALRAYRKIAEALGIEAVKFGTPEPVTGKVFFGSFARRGLDADVAGDAVYDVPYRRSPLRVAVNGKEVPESFLDHGYTGRPYEKKSKFENMHGGYFHRGHAEVHITNSRLERGALVIIGDSFSHCMERFFAEHYRDVYKLDARHHKGNFKEFLDSHAVDDVLLLFDNNATNRKFLNFF